MENEEKGNVRKEILLVVEVERQSLCVSLSLTRANTHIHRHLPESTRPLCASEFAAYSVIKIHNILTVLFSTLLKKPQKCSCHYNRVLW